MPDSDEAQALPPLETKCELCEGTGGETERRRWCACPRCEGAGFIPTEAGERVLALMRHNLKSMMIELTRESLGRCSG